MKDIIIKIRFIAGLAINLAGTVALGAHFF
jgi:hypothetical protein